MAEIFGAVASGAGLVSLSMQLLDSAQKLKGFYNLSRDAPETVRQLSFELETMSMALRQFEQYRQNDILGSELLSRCIIACDQAVTKIKTSVDKVDRLLSKARFAGKLYMGFKEPEIKKLLEEMEHAKSSLLLAHTGFSTNMYMRQAASNASALTLQTQHIEKLQATVEHGKVALIDHMTDFASQVATRQAYISQSSLNTNVNSNGRDFKPCRRGKRWKVRLSLPRWLVGCVWEFGMHECENVWTFQLSPINLRPERTYVFDFVRAGDVGAVRELIRSQSLSVHDQEVDGLGWTSTLLEMAASKGHLELCKFLLQETAHSAEDGVLQSALDASLHNAIGNGSLSVYNRQLLDAVYDFFVGKCDTDLGFDCNDDFMKYPSMRKWKSLFLTEHAFKIVQASQPVSLERLPKAQRFAEAVNSIGWPAKTFTMRLSQYDVADAATRTSEHGKTALHWAAAHLGVWSRRDRSSRLYGVSSGDLERIQSYAALASDLLKNGADVHALWYEPVETFFDPLGLKCLDPFLAFLAGVRTESDWPWESESLSDAVAGWGQMLVEGGHQLSEYVSLENEFLRSVQWEQVDHCFNFDDEGSDFIPLRLSVSEDLTLRLEIKNVLQVNTWEAQIENIPGAWPAAIELPGTIAWSPEETDRMVGIRWTLASTVRIESRPYQVHSLKGASNVRKSIDSGTWRELTRTQDDHGFMARLASLDAKDCHPRTIRLGRRRSSSLPPTMPNHESSSRLDPFDERHSISGLSGWLYAIHRCLLDSKWRACDGILGPSQWRQCVQGRCHRQGNLSYWHDSTFEGWFLRNDESVHVAKRYAQKFCPERMYIVDETLERVTERKRLAMGPKRRDDSE